MDDTLLYTYYYSSVNGTQTSIPSSKTLAVPIFLALLSFIGFVGNMCMMYAILGFKHMRTAPNILIFNLALGDLLYILIPTPIYIEHEINPLSDLSSLGCKLKAYVGFVGQYASVFALAALSHERFTAIVRGMEARRHGRDSFMSSSMCVVIFVWLASIVLPAPTLFFANVSNAQQCRSTSENTEVAIAYEFFRALTGYVIPLVTVGFYYMKIAISLFKSTKSFQNDFETAAMAHQVKVRRRLAASVLVITIFFAVCWFPYFFYNIWSLCLSADSLFGESNTATDYLRHAGIVMPVINTCMDPWLLFIISSKHRACLFQCLRCKGDTRASDSQSSRKSAITGRTRTSQGTSFSRVSRL
ncbi:bombesin receptor subtype-3-like [Asterias rubens]|uniref:bombesin receptor subtype-3-like n=1 Tax=Asterias rubens TaxID=7604 RepID=UPI0014553596|nr:bombesin receptor subtype-3-like [Asterias rubens]XP_033640357.1 bombesin receptor subtype-3-like [Asterias rubens]XP_033640358.1 bombesin receptor subtype-3-like [Asterias rubens]